MAVGVSQLTLHNAFKASGTAIGIALPSPRIFAYFTTNMYIKLTTPHRTAKRSPQARLD